MQKRRADGGCDLVVLAWARAMLRAQAETLPEPHRRSAEQDRMTRTEGAETQGCSNAKAEG